MAFSIKQNDDNIIDHPDDKENKYLIHGCLEGPEVGVYYRGTVQTYKEYFNTSNKYTMIQLRVKTKRNVNWCCNN